MNRWPDNPTLVSTAFLAELDAAAPGTYYAQTKWDGRRRIISTNWHANAWRAKDRGASQPPPTSLIKEFYAMGWPDGLELDCEYTGPRQKNGVHEIYVFDLLGFQDGWINWFYCNRRLTLEALWTTLTSQPHVHIVPVVENPGMVDFFAQQLTNPLSEGIVVRHKDHKHIGALNGCATSKTGFYKIKHREIKELP